jgi:hypothetical protein
LEVKRLGIRPRDRLPTVGRRGPIQVGFIGRILDRSHGSSAAQRAEVQHRPSDATGNAQRSSNQDGQRHSHSYDPAALGIRQLYPRCLALMNVGYLEA